VIIMSEQKIDTSFYEITGPLGAEALFVSLVEPSDEATVEQIRTAVTDAIYLYGVDGCAGLVAYEFGEHPEAAVARMRWASNVVAAAFAK
jgi:hypothetical protein